MKTLNFFIKAITLIPILTSLLYITGMARMDGFLKEFSISSIFYDLPIDRILYDGFINIFLMSTLPLISAMYAAIILFITSSLFKEIITIPFIKKPISRLLNRLKHNKEPDTATKNEPEQKNKNHAATILSNTLIAGVIFLSIYFLIIKAINVGISDANKLKANIKENIEEKVCVKTDEQFFTANVLYCGVSFCGFLIDKGSIIIPTASVKSISTNDSRCITKN